MFAEKLCVKSNSEGILAIFGCDLDEKNWNSEDALDDARRALGGQDAHQQAKDKLQQETDRNDFAVVLDAVRRRNLQHQHYPRKCGRWPDSDISQCSPDGVGARMRFMTALKKLLQQCDRGALKVFVESLCDRHRET